jgi:hypothetical protein
LRVLLGELSLSGLDILLRSKAIEDDVETLGGERVGNAQSDAAE